VCEDDPAVEPTTREGNPLMKRSILAVMTALLMMLGAVACGGSDDVASGESGDRASSASDEGAVDTTDLDDELDELKEDLGDIADDLGDDVGEALDNVPGLADGCIEVSTAYASLGAGMLDGSELAQDLSDMLDKFRDDIPEELEEPFSVIEDGFESAGADGVESIETPEFKAANDEITKWLEANCK